MVRAFSVILFLAAAGLIWVARSPYRQYLEPKQERLYSVWQKDFQQLNQDRKFAQVFAQVSKVEVTFTDPQVAEEFENFKTPFRADGTGGYVLKISITRWIEASEYGFVIQHELFDATEDKVFEFGRTYKIGLIL